MNRQPTPILLKFTDFLNNRDSLAFFRLCHSFWSAHRTPAGRYRLKSKFNDSDDSSVLKPSDLPPSVVIRDLKKSEGFSPQGNLLLDSLRLLEQEDYRLLNENCSKQKISTEGNNNSPDQEISLDRRLFDGVKNLIVDISYSLLNQLKEFGQWEKIQLTSLPERLESLKMGKLAIIEKSLDFLESGTVEYSHLKLLDLKHLQVDEESSRKLLKHPIFKQNTLETIILPEEFNCPIVSNSFPSSLIYLEFGYGFSSSLLPFSLPNSLEIIKFSYSMRSSFNSPLPFPLPKGLKELALGECYNQPILQIPQSLKIIRLGENFTVPLLQTGFFPDGLEEISLGFSYSEPILPGLLPSSLKVFHCHSFVFSNSSDFLPETLETLQITVDGEFPQPFKTPKSLKRLQFIGTFDFPIESPDFFPPQLCSINFGQYFNQKLMPGIFPPSVEEIILPGFNEQIEIGVFPPGLKKISFGKLNQTLPVGIFPDGIQVIELGNRFCRPLAVGLFPPSVRILRISTQAPLLPGIFPEGVECITFGHRFNEILIPGIFPSSLRQLKFIDPFESFQQKILPCVLPEFLCELDLGFKYLNEIPLESLPEYFRPEPFSSKKIFCRLNPPDHLKATEAHKEPENFLLNHLRVSIGPKKDSYVIVTPASSEDFLSSLVVRRSRVKVVHGARK